MRVRHLAVTSILFGISMVGGCGGSASAPAVEVPRVDRPPQSGLVWMRDEAGHDRTWWVALDGSPLAGQPIDGPLWADGEALWQMTIEDVPIGLYDEEPDEEGAPPDSERVGEVHRVVLRDLVDDARMVAVEAPTPGVVHEVEHEIRLEGSVGPYLFFVERLSVTAFGAHGAEEMRAVVWDLSAAAPADVATDRELARWEPEATRRARALPEVEEDASVSFVAFHPRWSPEGLAVELQVSAETCYACGDGEWSDYTRSARIALPEPPERLAIPLPAWAREAATRDGGTLMGFTRVESAAPAGILDSLSR
ncbi:MAG: hypothetical protein KC619_27465 [Myxococcales bacterium]|nr:hypothetical protein [Myxococcales bacterium]